ncbi:hypothetical protein D3C84_1033960 [compost metagenome]
MVAELVPAKVKVKGPRPPFGYATIIPSFPVGQDGFVLELEIDSGGGGGVKEISSIAKS